MEALSRHNSSLIGRKNQAKFENDCINFQEVGIDSKLLNQASQGTENPPFRFFFGHPA